MNLIEFKPLIEIGIIDETLERMGIANKKEQILYPSCYIINKDGIWYLAHFKQLLEINSEDGYDNVSDIDIVRLNSIANLLKGWGMIEIISEMEQASYIDKIDNVEKFSAFIFILPHKEKFNWKINHKINLNLLNEVGKS